MIAQPDIHYVTDEQGNPISVIIPISLWQEIVSERETAYLLKSDAMRQRLAEALTRQGGIALEDARAKLGL